MQPAERASLARSAVLQLLLIAAALAVDSFAVAVALGLRRDAPRGSVLRVALVFAACQAALAALGVAGGALALRWIGAFDHWIAAAVLAAFGLRTAWKAWREPLEQAPTPSLRMLVLLGLATSIDAWAVGFGTALLGVDRLAFVAAVGATTAFACVLGGSAARAIGARVTRATGVLGGLVLVALAVALVLEHRARGI
ncbi:MAG: hypothetical protein EPO68_14400 [Planctomycetota bacterium]|nr:MAG: hypothetical protein EPO68_14400 [Planctomycetota bacterium]